MIVEHGIDYWPTDTNNSEQSEPATVTVPPSDDTTPPTAPVAVINNDVPLEFDSTSGTVIPVQWIRAVDEAGNRSEIVSPEFVVIEN